MSGAAPFPILRAEAERLGWPVSFREDLRHDEDALACRADAAPFVWQIRPTGTFLVFPFPAAMLPASERQTHDAYRVAGKVRAASEHVRAIASAMDARARWYAWDGVALRSVTIDGAAEFCDRIEQPEGLEVSR